ncbi:hypothetical protein CPB86DRAFT_254141 [Serendipita vermifera]|nr:hypothetical protein CPB86DRAFT_254141 [Serendipita vermifera]
MNKLKEVKKTINHLFVSSSASAIATARPDLVPAIHAKSACSSIPPDATNISLDTSITTFKGIKEIAEAIPTVGGPLKATCDIMILLMETCQEV